MSDEVKNPFNLGDKLLTVAANPCQEGLYRTKDPEKSLPVFNSS